MQHVSVFLQETLSLLRPEVGDTVLDATLGLGGHASAFLERIGPMGTLVGLDADERNLLEAAKNLARFPNTVLIHGNFAHCTELLPQVPKQFNVILADLGLSSPHIDDPERGFTFRANAPLDMRFNTLVGETAARVLQASDPITLRRIFKDFGELPQSSALVEAIVHRRSSDVRVQTSTDLTDVVHSVYRHRAPKYLPQVFQALRIYVNDELTALQNFLTTALTLLAPGGRMGVISYHSLEDRIVKNSFRTACTPTKNSLTGSIEKESDFELLCKKPLRPTEEEVRANPRSRSAILRAILKRLQ